MSIPAVRIVASEVVKVPGAKEYREYTIEWIDAQGVVAESKHRYNDFIELHNSIPSLARTRFPASKSAFGLSSERAINERVALLQDYLRSLCDTLTADERVLLYNFLNVPIFEEANSGAPASAPAADSESDAPSGSFASASALAAKAVASAMAAPAKAATLVGAATPVTTASDAKESAPATDANQVPPVTKPVATASPAKFTPTVSFNVDPTSADGRVSLEIKGKGCKKNGGYGGAHDGRTMFSTP